MDLIRSRGARVVASVHRMYRQRPLAYLLDKPGISVMARLGLVEDRFEAAPFFLNVAMLWAVLLGSASALRAWRRGAAR